VVSLVYALSQTPAEFVEHDMPHAVERCPVLRTLQVVVEFSDGHCLLGLSKTQNPIDVQTAIATSDELDRCNSAEH